MSGEAPFRIVVDGIGLLARWVGQDDRGRAPIVLLHEGLGSLGLWRDLPERMAATTGRRVFAYERAGHGGSDPPAGPRDPGYLRHEGERVLPAVLDAVGVARCVPYGHSDGGSIALLLAAARPERVAACVTAAAHVFVEEETLAGIRQARAAWDDGLGARLARHHGAGTRALFDAWSLTWLGADFRNWAITDRLSAITCPVLAIQGRDDEYGTPAQVAAIVAGTRGHGEGLLLPGCGHAPHQQARDATLAAVAGFLARHEG